MLIVPSSSSTTTQLFPGWCGVEDGGWVVAITGIWDVSSKVEDG
jgi:hypothetical protein